MHFIKIFTFVVSIVVVFTTCLFYLSSCDDNPIKSEIEYGRRDYVWEVDTLDVPLHSYVIYRDNVGNSPDDIWLGNLDAGLYHYDGEKWEWTEFPARTPSALWLFEDNTLWIGTSQSVILKRENGVWAESYPLTYKDYDLIEIFGMYGKEKDDIYAVGIAIKGIKEEQRYITEGIFLHYNGIEWRFLDSLNLDEIQLNNIYYQESIDTYFIWAIKIEDGEVLDKLFTFDRKNLTEILSTQGSINLSTLKGIVYININFEVYKYINKELVLWKDFTGTEFISNFVGRNENDFFNRSRNGIGHYNGKDYVTIYPTHLDIHTGIVFEKDIFVTAEDSYNKHYIVIHGTLKDENKE